MVVIVYSIDVSAIVYRNTQRGFTSCSVNTWNPERSDFNYDIIIEYAIGISCSIYDDSIWPRIEYSMYTRNAKRCNFCNGIISSIRCIKISGTVDSNTIWAISSCSKDTRNPERCDFGHCVSPVICGINISRSIENQINWIWSCSSKSTRNPERCDFGHRIIGAI